MATGIVILNYNNPEDTINCVRSIEKCNSAPVKYIIVDNGSSKAGVVDKLDTFCREDFAERYQFLHDSDPVKRELPKMTFLASSTNDGYARGNNKGINLCYSDELIDSVLILNNDILFTEDMIPALVNGLRNLPECGVVSPLLKGGDNKSIENNCARTETPVWHILTLFLLHKRTWFNNIIGRQTRSRKILLNHPEYLQEDYFEIGIPSGSCMLLDKSILEQMRSLDPGTFLYYEENILGKRLKALGLRSYCIPRVSCLHIGGASTLKTSGKFRWRCNYESADYYLKHYCRMNPLQKLMWSIAGVGMRLERKKKKKK